MHHLFQISRHFFHIQTMFFVTADATSNREKCSLAAEIMSIGTATAHITSAKSCFGKQIFVLPSVLNSVQFDGQG
jgi:hypothetical protein